MGQGGPQPGTVRCARDSARGRRRWTSALALLVCALGGWLCEASWAAESSPIELRLRMAWGAGSRRHWEGTLRVAGATITDLHDIGVAENSAGSKYVDGDTIHIRPPGPTQYDGMDFTIRGDREARVVVELKPLDQPDAITRIDTPLAHFVDLYENQLLDEFDNRLLLRRAPGDVLRIKMDRDSLVFTPGESFAFEVVPHLLDVGANVALQLKVELFAARSDRELWSHQQSFRSDDNGRLSPLAVEPVPLPSQEGAYDIVVSIYRRPRLGVPLWRVVPIAQRKIQVVSISPKPPAAEPVPWKLRATVDETNPRWRLWTAQLPGWSRIPGLDQSKPLSNAAALEVTMLGSKFRQLAPGQWQAYPLEVANPHQPHLIEVEYPSHLAQSLGISIIEPNSAGEVAPIGIDSGVHVPRHFPDGPPQIERHRLVFWPKTNAPVVLLTNLHAESSAYFGHIRLYSGPATLPAAPLELTGDASEQRLVAAYFDKPLFPLNFSATDDYDATRQQSFDDWQKFYDGGKRLVEYLKYAGYNGAVICVARDGSAIYPTEVLPASPKYDNGVFFTTGQDVLRKDVLEMLFRLFDREGLRLIPAVYFAGRVEQIEAVRRRGGALVEGLTLIDGRGRVASTQYNPLDARIQGLVHRAFEELATRYGKHTSYGGVAVQLGPDSYLTFPDEEWGLDRATFARFLDSMSQSERAAELNSPAKRARLLESPEMKRAWLLWRAAELARMYSGLQHVAAADRPEARLYLATGELFQGRSAQRILQPRLVADDESSVAEAALQLGLDVQYYRDQPSIVLLSPQRLASGLSLNEQAANLKLASEAPEYFAVGANDPSYTAQLGSLFYHEYLNRRLPSFDAVSPFGAERTYTHLFTQAVPAGLHNRRRFVQSLATLDAQVLLDGGWFLPLGQEDALLPILETYRQLPREKFQLVTPRSEAQTQPVVVRQWNGAHETFIYLVNDSPWTASATIEIQCRAGARLQPIGRRDFAPPQVSAGSMQWSIQLAPYDLVAAKVTDSQARVEDWQVQIAPHVISQLEGQVRDVLVRAEQAISRPPLKALVNPDFETPAMGDEIPGWQFKKGAGLVTRLDDDQPYGGRHSLHLRSSGETLWVRSNAFRPPATGRLYVLVRLRVRDAENQPNLRVVLDDGEKFYWPFPVGQESSITKLPDGWGEDFLFPFEQLPLKDLEKLQIGFDLMGPGEVWIDDIELFDVWLQRQDRNSLMIASRLASKNLETYGRVTYCQQFLESFWPQFLLEHIPAPAPSVARAPALPDAPPTGPAADLRPTSESTQRRSKVDRVRELVPRIWR